MPNPPPLMPGLYYHIYNRGNNRENIFNEERNYLYFLQLWAKYIEPIAETLAYCLLRNHFHALVFIKQAIVQERLESKPAAQHFANLFNAYARAFNLEYQRTGALFQRPFGRIPISEQAHLIRMVTYIHQNPQKHGLINDFRNWPHSSYKTLLSTKPTHLKRDLVVSMFNGKEMFLDAHQQIVGFEELERLEHEP